MIKEIKKRRSCKDFLDKVVDIHAIKEIVECGLMAPSAKNSQSVKFCVISNKEILDELVKLAQRNFIYNAPVLIVVYCEKDYKAGLSDGACAISQMYLAAQSLGLGGCWINHLKNYENDPKYFELFERMGVKNKQIVGSFALGYPASDPKDKIMKENRVHFIQ